MCVASNAHADRQGFLSLPFLAGATSREDGRFSYGIRPELLISRDSNRGLALGPYLELERSSADNSVGAGLTVTYLMRSLNVAPSAGAYHRWADSSETGISAQLFVGSRKPPQWGGADAPLGLRVAYRSDFSDHDEVIVSMQVDVIALTLGWLFGGYTANLGM